MEVGLATSKLYPRYAYLLLRFLSDWSLQSIFGKRLTQSCPLADRSSITVFAPPDGPSAQAVTDDTVDFNVWPVVISPHDSADIDADDELSDSEKLQAKCRRFSAGIKRRGQYTFDTTASKHLNVEMRWPGEGSFIFRECCRIGLVESPQPPKGLLISDLVNM